EAGDIGAGAGLRDAEGRERRLGQELAEVALLLRLRAGFEQRHGGEPVRADGVRDARAPVVELFEDEAGVEDAQSRAAELGRDLEVHETELPRLAGDVRGERLL